MLYHKLGDNAFYCYNSHEAERLIEDRQIGWSSIDVWYRARPNIYSVFVVLLCLSLNHYISFGSGGCSGAYISCKSRPTIWGFCNLLKGTTAVLWRCPSHSKLDLQWALNWEPAFLSTVPSRMGYNRPLICILCFFLIYILRNVLVSIILSRQLYILMVARLCLYRAVVITFDHPSLHLHSFTCPWHRWCHRGSHAPLKFSLHSLLHQRRSSRPFAVQDIECWLQVFRSMTFVSLSLPWLITHH